MRKAKKILALMMTIALAASIPVSATATNNEEAVIEIDDSINKTDELTVGNSKPEQFEDVYYDDNYYYKPYDGATYELKYQSNDDGTIRITGYRGTAKGTLVIPDMINGNTVTEIGPQAFYCSGFTGNLTIPYGVTTIGDGAFLVCNDFTGSLIIPDSVTTIGPEAFRFCSGFTGSLTIPDSVTTIEPFAVSQCSGLTGSLTIPDSITSIGENAFYDCSGFAGNLAIPSSVTLIDDLAFEGCSGLTKIDNKSQEILCCPGVEGLYWINKKTGEIITEIANGIAVRSDYRSENIDYWGFSNSSSNFGAPGNGYLISNHDYQRLISSLSWIYVIYYIIRF